ncbi:F-box only protein 36b [Spinachia spinachia]
MASLLTDPLFETSRRGPPPNTNFYNFTVTKSDVIWRWWKISPRSVDRLSKPGELKAPHQDFLDDRTLQREVHMVFGQRILQYTKSLCQGHYGYLEHLSDTLLLRIVRHLEIEDIGQLGRTSRRFQKLCGSEELWVQAVQQRFNTVPAGVASLALDVGWRSIFFTSKLQLQKLLSRKRLKTKEQHAGHVSVTDTKGDESPCETSETHQTPGSEDDAYFGGIADLRLGTDPGTRIDTSSFCDIGPDPESVAASDSSVQTD